MTRAVPRAGRAVLLLALLVGSLLAAAVAFAGEASAHATVVSSDPQDGARLKAAPATVSISFDEAVRLGSISYLHVVDVAGRRVEVGTVYHPGGDGSRIEVRLKSGLGDGTYTESFRIVSADSHPVAGTVRFVVGNGTLAAAPSASATVDPDVNLTFQIVRWVSFGGFALLGGSWLLLTVWPQGRDDWRARRIVWAGLGAMTLGCVLELLLQGPYAAGTSLSGVTNWSLLDATLHSDYGQYHSARLVLLGGVALLLGWTLQSGRGRSRADDLAWPLGLGLALTFSAIGHAATTPPTGLSIAADLLHLSAMAAWIGGLIMLVFAVLPRREPEEIAATVPVVSRVAFASVAVLAVTGTYAAWHGVGTWSALFTTTYGLLVAFKVLLFVGIVLLGNVSRRVVQRHWGRVPVVYAMTDAPPAAQPEVDEEPGAPLPGVERLRRSVIVEVGLALIVLLATAALVGEPRGKEALTVEHQKPVTASATLGGGRSVSVTLDPGTHGAVTATVELGGGSAQSVTAGASLPSRQFGPIPLNLAKQSPTVYSASGINLPSAGTWVVEVTVTTSQFDAVTADVKLHLH